MKVEKYKIIQACNSAISEIEERRRNAFEAAVNEVLSTWWLKWYIKNNRTKAEAYVRNNPGGPFGLAYWVIGGWGTKAAAEKLIRACSVCSETNIDLSSDDASFVSQWIDTPSTTNTNGRGTECL